MEPSTREQLLILAQEIWDLVNQQSARAQDGDYAQVAVLGERLQQLFRQWEEMVQAAGDGGGPPVPAASELIREALELNQQTVALLEQEARQMQEIQQELVVARRTQRAYAAAQQAGPPLFNTCR